jgi:hypothetical protein
VGSFQFTIVKGSSKVRECSFGRNWRHPTALHRIFLYVFYTKNAWVRKQCWEKGNRLFAIFAPHRDELPVPALPSAVMCLTRCHRRKLLGEGGHFRNRMCRYMAIHIHNEKDDGPRAGDDVPHFVHLKLHAASSMPPSKYPTVMYVRRRKKWSNESSTRVRRYSTVSGHSRLQWVDNRTLELGAGGRSGDFLAALIQHRNSPCATRTEKDGVAQAFPDRLIP